MTDAEDLELAVNELFDRYADGYEDYDPQAIASCFAYPTVIWQLEEGHIFRDNEELIENLDALLDVHREYGIMQSVYEVVSVDVNGNSAFVTLDWQQEDEEGDVVFDFTCHYVLMLLEGEWKIATIINEPN
ncbi:DUF4440 domain-containing protein [Rhodobacteraceae bacterium RKSG542]|nr:DUF4440 domain-containing protein [Pseudovibrio flavus]